MIPPKKKLASALLLLFLTFLTIILYITPISSALGCLEPIKVNVSEPIEVRVVRDLDRHFYPGQQTDLMLIIKNKAHETCHAIITEIHKFPEGVYMFARMSGFNYKFGEKITMKPNQAIPVTITIVAPKDAGTGKITLTIAVKATKP